MSHVMLVEDDARIREATRMFLEEEGHHVTEVETGEDALEAFGERGADCVLVDLMLPGMDGFECCRALRLRSDVPIIVVSAKSDTFDVVAGLEAGADDYLTKPFHPKELAARIRAHLRRTRDAPRAGGVIVLGDRVTIAPDEGWVRCDDEEVHLTRTEFRLLSEMATQPGRVFTRENLLALVWGYDYFGDGKLVDVHVHRLRGKIESDPANPKHVLTVRGLGYKVVT